MNTIERVAESFSQFLGARAGGERYLDVLAMDSLRAFVTRYLEHDERRLLHGRVQRLGQARVDRWCGLRLRQ